MNDAPKTLVKKWSEVMAAVERVPKNGWNDHFKYHYATEADVADVVRKEMSSRHLVMLPDVESIEFRGEGKYCLLGVRWTIFDGETGESLSFRVPGMGQDSNDKGPYKALTGSQKYAMMKSLHIPTGDDPERDHKDDKDDKARGKGQSKGARAAADSGATQAAQTAAKDEAARLFPTTREEEKEVAAFEAGSKDCPSCGAQGTIIRGKPQFGGGWVCWARDKSQACGTKWPQKAQRTEEEKIAAVHRGPLTKEYTQERDRQLALATEISDELQLTEESRRDAWNSYCRGAHKANVDLAALRELVGYLNLRLDQRRSA